MYIIFPLADVGMGNVGANLHVSSETETGEH
jgi:hypothetical protein